MTNGIECPAVGHKSFVVGINVNTPVATATPQQRNALDNVLAEHITRPPDELERAQGVQSSRHKKSYVPKQQKSRRSKAMNTLTAAMDVLHEEEQKVEISKSLRDSLDHEIASRLQTEFTEHDEEERLRIQSCLLYTSPSPRDRTRSRMPSSA